MHTNPVSDPEGEFESMMGKYNIVKGLGVVAFGRDPVSLDAIFCNLAGLDTTLNDWAGKMLDKAEEEFGAYDRVALEESKMKVGSARAVVEKA